MSAFRKLTIRNYRCFNWENPAELIFGNGFAAIIGSNNSGKSSALRSVFELRHCFNQLPNAFNPANNFQVGAPFQGLSDPSELANDLDGERFQIGLETPHANPTLGSNNYAVFKAIFEFNNLGQSFRAIKIHAINANKDEVVLDENQIKLGSQHTNFIVKYSTAPQLLLDFSELFSFAKDLEGSKYYPAFRNAINEGSASYYDIPVGTALVQNWDQWKAGNVKANKIDISKAEQEIAALLGFKTLQINADQSGKTLDIIIDNKPHKLYEVGAGVAQLIIVLAAALIQKPTYILIDEPELNLHPSLQLNFLSTLGSYAKKGVLYSTHSIGLARSTAEHISVTRRLTNGSSSMKPIGDRKLNFPEMLGELSYSGRIDLGCEGIIIVEGPTDVLFFQEFLRKLKKDGKYVVMQLGGSSLINSSIATHLAELFRITEPSKIHIFIDSEKKSADEPLAKDRSDFLSECKKLGVRAVVSERRATENYLENKGIRMVLGEEFQALEPYQLVREASKSWKKTDNWKIARVTDFDDIKDTDFGQFLSSL